MLKHFKLIVLIPLQSEKFVLKGNDWNFTDSSKCLNVGEHSHGYQPISFKLGIRSFY